MALARVNPADDISSLLSIMSPSEVAYKGCTTRELFDIADYCVRVWCELVTGKLVLPATSTNACCPNCGEALSLSADDILPRAVFSVASHYDYLAKQLASAANLPQGEDLIPGLHLNRAENLRSFFKNQQPRLSRELTFLAHTYLICWQASYFFRALVKIPSPPQNLVAPFEEIAHDALAELNSFTRVKQVGRIGAYLFDSSLRYLSDIYKERENRRPNVHHKFGPFSAIQTAELSSLADRAESMIRKYGLKHIESIFEYQLSLIMNSLGFIVAQTRRAERGVDLVCISPSARPGYSFLLEAKTTARNYSLPAKDSRALLDYVIEAQRNLLTISPLRFVLIVGPSASRTLAEKVRRIEAEAGVPVRFCTATQLADLREQIPGPVLAHHFEDAILSGSHVLGEEFPQTLVQAQMSYFKSTSEYVRSSMFSIPSRILLECHETDDAHDDSDRVTKGK